MYDILYKSRQDLPVEILYQIISYVPFNGITIGTHARKIITNFETKPHKMSSEALEMALINARNLISNNLNS